jgi:hypothetical protein
LEVTIMQRWLSSLVGVALLVAPMFVGADDAPKKKKKKPNPNPNQVFNGQLSINGELKNFDSPEEMEKALKDAGFGGFGAFGGNFGGFPNAASKRKPDPLAKETGLIVRFRDAKTAKMLKEVMQKILDGADGAGRRVDFDLELDERSEAKFFAENDLETATNWLKEWLASKKPAGLEKVKQDGSALQTEELLLLDAGEAKADPTAVNPEGAKAGAMAKNCLERPGTLKGREGRKTIRWRVIVDAEWFAIVFPDLADHKMARSIAKGWKPLDGVEEDDEDSGIGPGHIVGKGFVQGGNFEFGPDGKIKKKKAKKKPTAKDPTVKPNAKPKKNAEDDEE